MYQVFFSQNSTLFFLNIKADSYQVTEFGLSLYENDTCVAHYSSFSHFIYEPLSPPDEIQTTTPNPT